jgi:hypothetical protein
MTARGSQVIVGENSRNYQIIKRKEEKLSKCLG